MYPKKTAVNGLTQNKVCKNRTLTHIIPKLQLWWITAFP